MTHLYRVTLTTNSSMLAVLDETALARVQHELRRGRDYGDWRDPADYIEDLGEMVVLNSGPVIDALIEVRDKEAERYYDSHYQSAAQLAGESTL